MAIPHSQDQPQNFEIPVGAIHGDWQADWAPGLTSPRLRQAIAENPRLADRPGASLARLLDLPALSAEALAPEDAHAFQVLRGEPRRFVHLVGLAAISPALAKLIDGEEVRGLMAEFQPDDLRLALECRDDADPTAAMTIERARFAQVAESAGPRLVQAWAEQLPAAYRGRLRLLFPKRLKLTANGQIEPSVNHNAGKVIRKVATLVSPPRRIESPDHGWT